MNAKFLAHGNNGLPMQPGTSFIHLLLQTETMFVYKASIEQDVMV
jgi:hypothetical protein